MTDLSPERLAALVAILRYPMSSNPVMSTAADAIEALAARLNWRESNNGQTHYDGCYRDHYGCAMAKIEVLAARVAELEAREVAVTRLMEAVATAIPNLELGSCGAIAKEYPRAAAVLRGNVDELRAALRELGVKE